MLTMICCRLRLTLVWLRMLFLAINCTGDAVRIRSSLFVVLYVNCVVLRVVLFYTTLSEIGVVIRFAI